VQEADTEGRALIDYEPAAPAVGAIEGIADLLEKQVMGARSNGSPGKGDGRGDQS
jgi:Flp pilus assembly CpaE family ATPase